MSMRETSMRALALATTLASVLAGCASDRAEDPCAGGKCDALNCPADKTEPNEFRATAPSIPAAGQAIEGRLAPPNANGELDFDFYRIDLTTDDPIAKPIRPTATMFVDTSKQIHLCAFYETKDFLGAPQGCLDGTVELGNVDDQDELVSMCCAGAERRTADGKQKLASVGLKGNFDDGTLYLLAVSLDESCVPYEIGFNR
jgi:hypothetical protein